MSNEKDAAAAAAADAESKAAAAKKRKDEEEAEAAAKAEARRLAEEDKILVVMVKDGSTLKVHPSTVADHQRVGWKVRQ